MTNNRPQIDLETLQKAVSSFDKFTDDFFWTIRHDIGDMILFCRAYLAQQNSRPLGHLPNKGSAAIEPKCCCCKKREQTHVVDGRNDDAVYVVSYWTFGTSGSSPYKDLMEAVRFYNEKINNGREAKIERVVRQTAQPDKERLEAFIYVTNKATRTDDDKFLLSIPARLFHVITAALQQKPLAEVPEGFVIVPRKELNDVLGQHYQMAEMGRTLSALKLLQFIKGHQHPATPQPQEGADK